MWREFVSKRASRSEAKSIGQSQISYLGTQQRIDKHYFQGTMKWRCLSANYDTIRVVKVPQTSFSPSGIVVPAGLLEMRSHTD